MIALPDCLQCRHYRVPEPGCPATCDAFPDSIPRAILIEGRGHRNPFPGDHGILFEPKSDLTMKPEAKPVLSGSR